MSPNTLKGLIKTSMMQHKVDMECIREVEYLLDSYFKIDEIVTERKLENIPVNTTMGDDLNWYNMIFKKDDSNK